MKTYVFAYYTHEGNGFQRDSEAMEIMKPYSAHDLSVGSGTDLGTGLRDIQWEVADLGTAEQARSTLERSGFRAEVKSY